MATRDYQFISGPETSDLPTSTDPVADADYVPLGYALKNFARGVADVAAVKAIGATNRQNNLFIFVTSLNAFFVFNSGSSATGNDTTVITPTAGSGRWLRIAIGGGGGGGITWIESSKSPAPQFEDNFLKYLFDAGDAQELYCVIKVPSSYAAGSQIFLKTQTVSGDSSGTVLMSSVSTLIRTGTDAITSTTNQRTSTNAAATQTGGTATKPQALSLDITGTDGTINSVAVSPGDLILVKFFRGTDTATQVVKVPVHGAEFTFS